MLQACWLRERRGCLYEMLGCVVAGHRRARVDVGRKVAVEANVGRRLRVQITSGRHYCRRAKPGCSLTN